MTAPPVGEHDDERAALVRLWLDRSGSAPVRPPAAPPQLPRPGEAQLIAIWQDVLEREGIGTDDDYFALGGDSIAAVAVVSRARAAGMPMTTHDLFELRTIGALVGALGPTAAPTPGEAGTVPAAGLSASGGRREELTPLQRGILFDTLADPTGRTQLVQIGAQLDGDVDVEQFTAACRTVFGRHRGLRASVGWDATGSWLEFAGDVPLPVRVIDLRQLPPQQQAAELQTETERDLAGGMNLRAAPLLRVTLARLSDRTLRFVLTHHHLVLDGWSQQLVLKELLDLYDGAAEADLPDPNDGISEHRRWLAAHDLEAGMTRWRQLLSQAGPSSLVAGPAVSGDRPTHARALTVYATLPDLVPAAREHQVTPATIVYAAWSVVVAELTGADDVVIGVTLSGRPGTLPHADSAVGMFIATLPLRARTSSAESFQAWARRLQSDRAELDELQHCPLPDIARSAAAATAAGGQLFDTIAVVENFPEAVVEGTQSRRLRLTRLSGTVWEGYPLVLEVRVGRPAMALLRADTGVVPERRLHAIHAALSAALVRIAAGPPPTVADLRSVARAELAAASARRQARLARRQPVTASVPFGDDSPTEHPQAR